MSQFGISPSGPPRGDAMALLAQLASQLTAGRDRNLLASSEAIGGGLQNLSNQKMQAAELVARIRASQQQQQAEQAAQMSRSVMANTMNMIEGAADRKSREKIEGARTAAMSERSGANQDPMKAELYEYFKTGIAGPMLTRAAAGANQDIPTYADSLLSGRSQSERSATNSVDDNIASQAAVLAKMRSDPNTDPDQLKAAQQRFSAEFEASKSKMTPRIAQEIGDLSGVWSTVDSQSATSQPASDQKFWPRIGQNVSSAATGLVGALSGGSASPGPGIRNDPTMQDTLRAIGVGPVSGYGAETQKMSLLQALRGGAASPTLDLSTPRDTMGSTGMQLPGLQPMSNQSMQQMQAEPDERTRAMILMKMLGYKPWAL